MRRREECRIVTFNRRCSGLYMLYIQIDSSYRVRLQLGETPQRITFVPCAPCRHRQSRVGSGISDEISDFRRIPMWFITPPHDMGTPPTLLLGQEREELVRKVRRFCLPTKGEMPCLRLSFICGSLSVTYRLDEER